MTDFSLCGWRLRTAVDMPELPRWDGDGRAPEVIFRIGDVPAGLDRPVMEGPFVQVAADGTVRFAVDSVGRFLIRGGTEIVLAPNPAATPLDLRAMLLGTPFGVLCHQRDMLPLHASCVVVEGRAVAITAESGVGKSTLAAELARRGHPLLAEDVCVIDCHAAGGPLVLPSPGRLKLWRDAIDFFGFDADPARRIAGSREKYDLAHLATFHSRPLPLAAIVHLTVGHDSRPAPLDSLHGFEAVTALRGATYRWRAAQAMGRVPALFAAAVRLAALPNRVLARGDGLAGLEALADRVAGMAGTPS